MKKALMLLFIALASLQAQRENLASLSGRVVNSVTGEPIRGASLLLEATGSAWISPDPKFSTSTDANGVFAMKELPPGQYTIKVGKGMFQTINTSSMPLLKLTPGQRLTDMQIKMNPLSAVSGRVTDEFGDGMANAAVSVVKYAYAQNGTTQPIQQGTQVKTNDLGEFRIHDLNPGKYYVVIDPPVAVTLSAAAVDKSEQAIPNDSYIKVFYPGTIDVESATQIQVGAGAVVQGINIRLPKFTNVQVSGRIINPVGDSHVRLSRQNSNYWEIWTAAPKGEFILRNVPPGDYRLIAQPSSPRSNLYGGFPITVGSQNVENIAITLTGPFDLKGTIRTEGTAPEGVYSDPTQPYIRLVGTRNGSDHVGRLNPEGILVFERVGIGEYIVLDQPRSTTYLKSVKLGDEDILDTPRTISSPGSELVFTYGLNPGRVRGTVTTEKGDPLQRATVVLVREGTTRRPRSQTLSNTASEGIRFDVQGLAPGKYKIYAWERIEENAWFDPDVLRDVEAKGKTVEVTEGGTVTIDLKALPPPE